MTLDTTDCGSNPRKSATQEIPETMFRRLVECTGQGIGWIDLAGNVVYMNPALRHLLEIPLEVEVGGFDLRRYRTPEAALIIESMLSATLERGSWSGEVDLLTAQGRVVPTRHDVHLIRDDAGVAVAMTCVVTDLTLQKQREHLLGRSKSKYRALVENIPQRVFYKDLQSRFLAVNQHFADDLGISPQSVIGKTDYDFYPRELADKYRADDQRLMSSGQMESYDEPHVHDGQRITVHTIKTPVRDAAGEVIGICGIFWDVSQQFESQQALIHSEALLKEAQAIAHLGNWNLDLVTGQAIWSDEEFRLLGYAPGQVLASVENFQHVVHPDDRAAVMAEMRLAMNPGESRPFLIEHRVVRPDADNGIVRIVEQQGRVLFDDEGQPLRMYGTTLDVTDQRQAEALLRAERNFTGAVLDNAGALILVLDREGRIRRFNRACEALSGFTFAEVEGRLPWDFLLLPEERDRVREQALLALINDPETLASIHTNHWLDKYGGKHLLEWRRASLLDDQGRLEYLVAIGIDVTEKREVEAALRRSEETYAEAEAIAHLGSWDLDMATGLLRWTDEVFRIFGYPPQSFVATHEAFMAAVPSDDRQLIINAMNASVAEANTDYAVEHRVIRPDGKIRIVQERGKVYRDASGMPIRMIGSVHDITERKQAERELERYREHLEELVQIRTNELDMLSQRNSLIVNTALDGFFSVGVDGQLVDCNEAYCRMLGYDRQHMLKLRIPDIEAIETPEEIGQRIKKINEQGHDRFETRHRRQDGSLLDVEVSVTLARISGDTLFFAFVHDISARKQAEKAILRNQTMLTRTERIAHIGSWEWDVATDTVFWSDELFRIFQRDPAEKAPSFAEHHQLYYPEDLQRLVEAVTAAVDLGTPYELELRAIRKDGTTRGCLTRGYAVRGADQRVVSLFGSLQDITERKLAEAEVLRAKNEAERANLAKSEFLSRMSHELRTPLNAILGFGQLLERAKLPGVQADNVQEVLHAGRHLLDLINEVLDLARIESGKFTVNLESVALLPLVTDCINLMQPMAENSGIELIEVIQSGNWQVSADPMRLRQVLLNLLSNAIKYNHKKGSVSVTYLSNDDVVTIRVKDTGPGLTAEQQARLFVPFERLDADNTQVEGTGIGLALSKRLMELMNGKIGVDSTPGAGSTFWVSLPLARNEAVVSGGVVVPEARLSESSTDQPMIYVLYIEDNPANLRLVERILAQRAEIRLLSASAPRLGLELAQAYRPAMILLDINLPEMDGFEVLRRLRDNPATRNIPVIGISANAMPQDIERARAAGFADYLTKPLQIDQFLSVVGRTLDCLSEPGSP